MMSGRHETVIATILEASGTDPELLKRLKSDPADVFVEAGVSIAESKSEYFNAFFWSEFNWLLDLISAEGVAAITANRRGFWCGVCKIAAYALAVILAGLGAAAIASLTESGPIVVALADWTGFSRATCLLFVQGLAADVLADIAAVVKELCEWTGAC